MSKVCYLCGKILSNSPKEGEVKTHNEHIIQNAIIGKLSSDEILCENCGNSFSAIDSEFVNIFAPFLDVYRVQLYSKDHGRNSNKTIRGFIYNEDKKIEVYKRRDKIYPVIPYYEANNEERIITIYAEHNRCKNYEYLICKKLPQYKDFKFIYVDDLTGGGQFGMCFSEGNANFNKDFLNGISKIALDFAMYCNIKREDVPLVLSIQEDNNAVFETENTPLIPYFPNSEIALLYEMLEPVLDANYPQHILRLYTTSAVDKNILVCYISLFGTFKFFVILNKDYKGESVDKVYAQRVLRPKEIIQKTPISYDLDESLSISKENFVRLIHDIVIGNKIKPGFGSETIEENLKEVHSNIGLNTMIDEITKSYSISNYIRNTVYCYDDSSDVIKDNVQICNECAQKKPEVVKEYTNFKFNQLYFNSIE